MSGLWDHYETLTDDYRRQLDNLSPDRRQLALDRWESRRVAVAAMRDAIASTAGVLDTTVDLLILELKEQDDPDRRDAMVDFMIEICGTAACARAFVDGKVPSMGS